MLINIHQSLTKALGKKYGRAVKIGHREVRKFILYPTMIRDGTYRCIRCGQIDECGYHDSNACADVPILAAAILAARSQTNG